ncbi:hypothetical protein [Thiomicrorhabdus xiamenensis]|uniref:Uncharacterized protein n=1 Tax=Thiomicrorhabdus xiamenensis TaxID=2739063 RepID=A0A7D4T1Y3_9GAMM|nr:hypothetical protein [Thiomicrorhabdus xiamenensis]QKI89925.1 hypothetical protein HQN79_10230 [Thiomicrorhabdus xiamenensis]
MLSIAELTKRVQENAKNRTHEERIRLLKKSRILDEDESVNEFFTTIRNVSRHAKIQINTTYTQNYNNSSTVSFLYKK